MRPLRRLRVSVLEFWAIVRAVNETAKILSQPAKRPPIIIPGRPEDFGR